MIAAHRVVMVTVWAQKGSHRDFRHLSHTHLLVMSLIINTLIVSTKSFVVLRLIRLNGI